MSATPKTPTIPRVVVTTDNGTPLSTSSGTFSSSTHSSYSASNSQRKRKYRRFSQETVESSYIADAIEQDEGDEEDEDECDSPQAVRREVKSYAGFTVGSSPSVDEDRRAHHNELERRRRDHIKDHFMALKNSIPLLEGEKSSRALILKRAVDYIGILQSQTREYKQQMEELRRQNEQLAKNQLASFVGSSSAMQSTSSSLCGVHAHGGSDLRHQQLLNPIPMVSTLTHSANLHPLSPLFTTASQLHSGASATFNQDPVATQVDGLLSALFINSGQFEQQSSQLVPHTVGSPLPPSGAMRIEVGQPLYSIAPTTVCQLSARVDKVGGGTGGAGGMPLQASLLLNSLLLREKQLANGALKIVDGLDATMSRTLSSLQPSSIITAVSS